MHNPNEDCPKVSPSQNLLFISKIFQSFGSYNFFKKERKNEILDSVMEWTLHRSAAWHGIPRWPCTCRPLDPAGRSPALPGKAAPSANTCLSWLVLLPFLLLWGKTVFYIEGDGGEKEFFFLDSKDIWSRTKLIKHLSKKLN